MLHKKTKKVTKQQEAVKQNNGALKKMQQQFQTGSIQAILIFKPA